MTRRHTVLCTLAALALIGCDRGSAGAADDLYTQQIEPFAKKYCVGCHNAKQARGELDLTRATKTQDVVRDFRRWHGVLEFVQKGEMPPEDARQQPTLEERNAFLGAIKTILVQEAKKHAGDPGVILPRRLSNTEFDLSIRDLTGVDIRPTRDFPIDPAGGEGFDNTGEALSMSPNLIKKYLGAAQQVSQHLVLMPEGIVFAPYPVTSYNERKKLTELAIVDFYRNHNVRIADYVEACYRYRHRAAAEQPLTIAAWAKRSKLSEKYMALVWQTLNEASGGSGYLQQLGKRWEALPAPAAGGALPTEYSKFVQFLEFCQAKLSLRQDQLIKSDAGNWPIAHLAFRAKIAATRDQFRPDTLKSQAWLKLDKAAFAKADKEVSAWLRVDPMLPGAKDDWIVARPLVSKSSSPPKNDAEAAKQEVVTLRALLEETDPALAKQLPFGKHPQGEKLDADSLLLQAPARLEIALPPAVLQKIGQRHLHVECKLDPVHADQSAAHVQLTTQRPADDAYPVGGEILIAPTSAAAKSFTASAEKFCATFPNRFFYVDPDRGLAAGFHLVEGFFRDDQPLVKNVLTEQEKQTLDRLWLKLDFLTRHAETLLRGFVWFERAERHVLHDARFDFLRSEDPLLVEAELLGRFERVYLGKLGVKLLDGELKPEKPSAQFDLIHGFFEDVRRGLAQYKKTLQEAEPLALRDLDALAERAYRRPLRPAEQKSLHGLYRSLRQQGIEVEEALRGVFVAIVMAPDFCFHYTEAAPGAGAVPLSQTALASRLSYFLWSSMPDAPLLAADLRQDASTVAQARRMLRDPKSTAFAREFFGQWLRYRDYPAKDPIPTGVFSTYNDKLRQAMAEEPVRLLSHLIQEDKPITALITSDATFVNGVLANHYGGGIASAYKLKTAQWTEEQKKRGLPADKPDEVWHEVADLRKEGRGGLLGMGVILTKNSAGERTSPVKRGFWVAHHLLGQHFPPPPADVAALPAKEKEASKTIRELLADHAANARCAICHTHFDGLGLAMEGFDPIGRARTKDLAGRAVDNKAALPGGLTAKGVPELIAYLDQHRRQDFVRHFCRKFLGYALGRSVLLSDQPLLDELQAALEKQDYRFSVLVEKVVTSPQFRNQRGRDFVANDTHPK